LGITWLLIDQAVRLAMFADRHLIRSMQLVGADDGFIRKPYLRQALMASVLALCGAGVLLAVTVFWVLDWAPDLHHPDSVVYLPWMGALWASFALLGGWLSHFAALNKYLRLDTDQLHA
jgi:cell division transport system permease protein